MVVDMLCWLRFGKRFKYVSTECGEFNADVLGSDGKQLIEIEVKVSKADFLADFRNKAKHNVYANPQTTSWPEWIPHKFYIIVPPNLADFAKDFLAMNYPRYGLIVMSEQFERGMYYKPESHVLVKAAALHREPVPPKVLNGLLMRMSSEICGLRIWNQAARSLRDSLLHIQAQKDIDAD